MENYRDLPLPELFQRLEDLSLHLDKTSFVAYAHECESPEDFKDYLIGDWQIEAETEDRIYLLIFELWRRLMPEKPSVSIFCDELDHQIDLYDRDELKNLGELEKAIDHLMIILNENVDEGVESTEAFSIDFKLLRKRHRNFLYDFISEQIDEENDFYARDLLDAFNHYFKGNKWFEFFAERAY